MRTLDNNWLIFYIAHSKWVRQDNRRVTELTQNTGLPMEAWDTKRRRNMLLERWNPQTSGLARWDPFSDLLDTRREMDRLFGSLFGATPASMAVAEGVWSPAVDIYETKEAFLVKA